MLYLLKADFYRIFKSKSFYITLGLLITFVVGTVLNQSLGSVGVMTDDKMAFMDEQALSAWTGIQSMVNMLTMMSILQYFIIPLLITLVGADFAGETYKNTLTTGISRTKYYATKMLAAFILCILVAVIFVGVAGLIGTITSGFGTFDSTMLFDILKSFGSKLIILFCFALLGISSLMITKSKVSAILICILLPVILQVLGQMPNLTWINDYNIFMVIENLEFIDFTTTLAIRYSLLSIVYILITTVGGTCIFNRKSL